MTVLGYQTPILYPCILHGSRGKPGSARSALQRRIEQRQHGLPMALAGGDVVDGKVGEHPAVAGGIGLDFVVDAGVGQRFLEALLHLIGEGLVLDCARDVEARLHPRREHLPYRGIRELTESSHHHQSSGSSLGDTYTPPEPTRSSNPQTFNPELHAIHSGPCGTSGCRACRG